MGMNATRREERMRLLCFELRHDASENICRMQNSFLDEKDPLPSGVGMMTPKTAIDNFQSSRHNCD